MTFHAMSTWYPEDLDGTDLQTAFAITACGTVCASDDTADTPTAIRVKIERIVIPQNVFWESHDFSMTVLMEDNRVCGISVSRECGNVTLSMPYPSIANRRLSIQHDYVLVSDRDTITSYLVGYWTSCGFNLVVDPGGLITGTRGSYLANFTSFDSTKLISSIHIDCTNDGHVQTSTVVDLSGQVLTAWNQLDLELEQVLCHRGFTGLDEPEALNRYRRSRLVSNIMCVLTLGLTTNVMPATWRTLLEDVNPSTISPILRYLTPGEY